MKTRLIVFVFFVFVIFKSTLVTDPCGDSSKAPAGQRDSNNLAEESTKTNFPKKEKEVTDEALCQTVHVRRRLPPPLAAHRANAGPTAQ